jgi:transaldolase
MTSVPYAQIQTKLFADGADLESILSLAKDERIAGFTTNPTLMRQAGISDYARFANELLSHVSDRPISFEVFADDAVEIRRQALIISSWAENVYVKIPVTTTKGESLADLVRDLSTDGVKVNVTAMFTLDQVKIITDSVKDGTASYLSIFAGRIADAGIDPVPLMAEAIEIMKSAPLAECIWASPREVLNLIHANSVGCHIITMTNDLLKKLGIIGKDLTQYSLETVQMFFNDASSAGYRL